MHASAARYRFCVAPMMDWTDRHDRFFLRQISRAVRLYTQMITTQAIICGQRDRLLDFHPEEHPLALQVGGSDPSALAECARIAEGWGYDEVNLNVGCPSNRVRSGSFGACLMRNPDLVADCVSAMRHAVAVPVTVKCRIGVDEQNPESVLPRFIDTVADAGCRVFIIHARKAWLDGLSPAENRSIPPLDHELVHAMKSRRPDLCIVTNGGITSLDQAAGHLERVDGVMLGRAAYRTPWILSAVDRRFFGLDAGVPDRWEVAGAMSRYAADRMAEGTPLKAITRHLAGLFQGLPGARSWRRSLAEDARASDAGFELILRAASLVTNQPATAS